MARAGALAARRATYLELVLERVHGHVAHFLHGRTSHLRRPDGHRRREVRADRLGDGGVDALGRHEHLVRLLLAADFLRPHDAVLGLPSKSLRSGLALRVVLLRTVPVAVLGRFCCFMILA